MNPDHEVELTGKLAALELLVTQSLSFGLAPIRHRADLVEEIKQQHHAKLERLPADARAHALTCHDRLLYAALATAEQVANTRVG
ncbi:MAG TPA: hypothetical protein VJ063_07735 [Verrucomicrobiae bacterium]|nr:hypothetical protein [Verrucomicrobiae bacterium]